MPGSSSRIQSRSSSVDRGGWRFQAPQLQLGRGGGRSPHDVRPRGRRMRAPAWSLRAPSIRRRAIESCHRSQSRHAASHLGICLKKLHQGALRSFGSLRQVCVYHFTPARERQVVRIQAGAAFWVTRACCCVCDTPTPIPIWRPHTSKAERWDVPARSSKLAIF